MYQQVARTLLRASSWRHSLGLAVTVRAPVTGSWLRPRCLISRAVCSSSRVVIALNQSTEPSKPALHNVMHQALELGVQLPELCSGCGVYLQAGNPDAPGFFQISQRHLKQLQAQQSKQDDQDSVRAEPQTPSEQGEDTDRLQRQQDVETSTSGSEDVVQPSILCARCYSLRHYGHIISQQSEAALPGFDLTRKVGRKIKLQKYRRAVVLCVVDMADFDGSLPRAALQELLPGLEQGQERSQAALGYRLVIAASKVDLLPAQATAARLQAWIRRRCKQAGLPSPADVHLISSVKGTGVKNLLTSIQEMVGMRGDVWVVGAQNAGKSSLINAMQKLAGLKGTQQLTTAAHPGTTLGMLKVDGLLQSGCRMWDTPGVPHPYQLSSKLFAEEVRMLLPRRKLKPRTFRATVGQTILVGGLARVDLVHLPAQTIYLTVWASDEVSCHYGRTDKADERYVQFRKGVQC
ncbi:hypothetical protein ABBQ32_008402 [Trebouxia sp. C0010 RCD-2024]